MARNIYLDFSGWCKLSPDTKLQYFGEDESCPAIISVTEWLQLSKEMRQWYVIEDIVAAIRDAALRPWSDDLEWQMIEINEASQGDDCPYCGGDCERNEASGVDAFCDGYAGDIDGLSEGQ